MAIPGTVTGESSESTWNYTYAPRGNESVWIMASDEPDKLMGQLASITDDQGRKVEYQTDLFGTRYVSKSNESYNGNTLTTWLETDYSYDVPGGGNTGNWRKWLLNISNVWHGVNGQNQPYTQTLASNTYTLDNVGQRLTNAALAPDGTNRTEVYGYDPTNRLTSVNYGDGQTQGYSFDAMGNRLSKTDSVTGNESYSYDNANRLLTRGSNTYTNDSSGNTLTGGGRTNVWDSENRLISCTYNGTTSNYTYGSDGLRRRAVIGSTTTDFVLDGTMQARELRGANSFATYLIGARGPEYRRDENSGTVRWYLYDGLGSVLGELDPNGNVTASRKFDVYGGVRSSAGTSTSKHKFCGSLGHPSDDESGLVYMRARYMDPQTGRFVSEDPGRSGRNWFTYASGAPTCRVDHDGRVEVPPVPELPPLPPLNCYQGEDIYTTIEKIIASIIAAKEACNPISWAAHVIDKLTNYVHDLIEGAEPEEAVEEAEVVLEEAEAVEEIEAATTTGADVTVTSHEVGE